MTEDALREALDDETVDEIRQPHWGSGESERERVRSLLLSRLAPWLATWQPIETAKHSRSAPEILTYRPSDDRISVSSYDDDWRCDQPVPFWREDRDDGAAKYSRAHPPTHWQPLPPPPAGIVRDDHAPVMAKPTSIEPKPSQRYCPMCETWVPARPAETPTPIPDDQLRKEIALDSQMLRDALAPSPALRAALTHIAELTEQLDVLSASSEVDGFAEARRVLDRANVGEYSQDDRVIADALERAERLAARLVLCERKVDSRERHIQQLIDEKRAAVPSASPAETPRDKHGNALQADGHGPWCAIHEVGFTDRARCTCGADRRGR